MVGGQHVVGDVLGLDFLEPCEVLYGACRLVAHGCFRVGRRILASVLLFAFQLRNVPGQQFTTADASLDPGVVFANEFSNFLPVPDRHVDHSSFPVEALSDGKAGFLRVLGCHTPIIPKPLNHVYRTCDMVDVRVDVEGKFDAKSDGGEMIGDMRYI